MSGAVAANSGSHLIGRLEPRPPVIGQESSYAYTDTHTALSLHNYQQQRTEQRDMSVASCVSAMKPDNVKMKIGAPSLSHSPPSLLAPPPRQPPPLSLPPTNTQQTHTSVRDAGSNNKIASQSQDTRTASLPTSTSSCLRWAGGLHSLLDDKDGVEHFQTFLNDEGCAAMLKFWFACQGLKQHPSTSTSTSTSETSQLQHKRRLIVAMYRRFVKTTPSSLKPSTCSSSRDQSLGRNHLSLPLSEAVRERLTSQIEGGRVGDLAADVTIFDAAQQEVESIMERTLYPNFLQSDYYIQLVRQTEEHSNVGTACVDPAEAALGGTASATGDTSLSSGASSRGEQESGTHHSSTLTRTTLLQTQHNRNKMPSTNAKNNNVGGREIIDGASGCVGRSLSVVSKGGATVANPYHTLYSSYNPVSRQESELQSMSSGATGTTLTDDNASSVDGRCARVVGCGRSHPPTTSSDHQRNTRHHLASNHRNHNHNHHRNHHNRKSNHQYRAIMREHAHVNHESSAAIYRGMIIQRSAKNVNSMQVNPSVDFDGFARILTVRLQQVLLDREMSDRASISDCMSGSRQYNHNHNHHNHNHNHGHNHSHNQWSDEANALVMEQTRYTEQNDQEILDAHISMVFESSRPTPQQHLSGHHSPSISTSGGGGGCVAAANSMPLWMSLPRSSTSSWQHHQQTPQLNASASRSSNMAKSRTFPDPVPTLARQVLPTSSGSQSRRQTAGVSSATIPSASSGVGPSASSMTASNLRSQDIPSEKVLDWMRSSEQQQQHTNKESVIDGATLSIAYTFCDEKVPYRTRVSVAHNRCSITLKHFKQLLPRRGNFRYFFKTACDDFESGGVVQEEIVDDSSLLPLWQGKIHAQVMSLRD